MYVSALLLFPSGDGRVYVFVCFSQSCCQFHKPLLWVCQTVAYFHGEKQNEAMAANTASLADSPRVVDKTDARSEIRPYFTCVTISHTDNNNRSVLLFGFDNKHMERNNNKYSASKHKIYRKIM